MPDIDKIRELQSKVMKDIAAGAIIPIMMIGDELGLFEKLYEFGPCSSEKFAKKIEMDHRYLREWLLACLLYTSPSPRDISGSRMPSSA